ncbi:PcfJ domain-containing protein [Oscillospiraceae bacterium 21-37]
MLVKKILEALPLTPAPKPHGMIEYAAGAAVHKLPRCGKVLAVDVYNRSGELLYRFFSGRKNYITWIERPFGGFREAGWTKRIPVTGVYYGYEEIESSKEILALVRENLRLSDGWYSSSSSLAHCIGNYISNLNWEKRRRAEERKYQLMKKHFAMFPAYPKDLAEFCENHVFAESVLYVSKLEKGKRQAVCRHCGKSFKAGREIKPGGSGPCPKCGIPVKYRAAWAKGEIRHKAQICIAYKVEGQLLLRYTDVERIIGSGKKKPDYYFSDCFYTLFLTENGKPKEYAYAWGLALYRGYSWRRLPDATENLNQTFVYTPNLHQVFGEKYYNVDLQDALTGLSQPIAFRRLLDNLKNIPQAEYLVKAGLPVFASSILPDGKAKSLRELTGLGKEFLPVMRECQASFREIRVVALQDNPKPEELRQLCDLRLDGVSMGLLEEIAHFSPLGRALRYVQAQWQQAPWQLRRRKLCYFFTLYRDYLNMADTLQSDMEKRAILEPRDLKERHHLLASRIVEQKDELENQRFQRAVDSGLYSWAQPYARSGYCVAYPESRGDFLTEGQQLNHCVGAKMYYESHILGQNMIFFIRKAEAPGRPYFTAEIEMDTGRVRQLYGFADCSAPKEVRAFTEGFARAAVKWKSAGMRRTAG